MLADPFVLGAESLPRTKIEGDDCVYTFYRADGLSKIKVSIRHTEQGGKNGSPLYLRSNIEVRETIFATATLDEYENVDYVVSLRRPGMVGVVNLDNLADWIIAGVNANMIRVLKGEA